MQEPSHSNGRTSVAVVGTGMAGLVSAYLLNKDPERRFDIEVFEAVRVQKSIYHVLCRLCFFQPFLSVLFDWICFCFCYAS